ncbi:hypothetical protein, partial [Delftia tsuruhatensis]|uniref:hypothetical protein n=1 Tax=Delftia tsuruhatensis TaxID=180282 RepID=UPI001969DCC6
PLGAGSDIDDFGGRQARLWRTSLGFQHHTGRICLRAHLAQVGFRLGFGLLGQPHRVFLGRVAEGTGRNGLCRGDALQAGAISGDGCFSHSFHVSTHQAAFG